MTLNRSSSLHWGHVFHALTQERHNSSALAMELCLPFINPSTWGKFSSLRCCSGGYILCYVGGIRPPLEQHFRQESFPHVDGLVKGRHNSIAIAPELSLSCVKPSTGVLTGINLGIHPGNERHYIVTTSLIGRAHT